MNNVVDITAFFLPRPARRSTVDDEILAVDRELIPLEESLFLERGYLRSALASGRMVQARRAALRIVRVEAEIERLERERLGLCGPELVLLKGGRT